MLLHYSWIPFNAQAFETVGLSWKASLCMSKVELKIDFENNGAMSRALIRSIALHWLRAIAPEAAVTFYSAGMYKDIPQSRLFSSK